MGEAETELKAAAAAPGVATTVVQPPKRIVVNTSDPAMVKRTLDCEIVDVVNVSGFESDMFLSNFRIAAGLIACVLALAGQFWSGTFPANSRQIGFCVIGYFFFSALMTVPSYFAVADWIDVTHSAGKKAPNGLIVCASLPRGKTDYTFRIAARAGRRSLYPNVATQVERTVSVADFFDVNGVFLQLAFREQVFQLVEAFVQQRGVASASSHAADKKPKSS